MKTGYNLTILTPSYNRAFQLKELYFSLCEQINKNFIWVIIDDGSTDITKEVVKEFIARDKIYIEYLYKENGGKHTAINYAMNIIITELVFIVDSDDTLTKDAVEIIYQYHKKYQDKGLGGYSFLRRYPNGIVNGMLFKRNELIGSYIDVRINSDDMMSDKAEVFYTNILKEFPFPEYPGEKFLGEDIVWIQMARKYQMVHINKAIYVGNYQGDGLTKNRRKNNIISPMGCLYRAKEFMKKDVKLKYRIKATLQYVIYGKFAGYSLKMLFHMCNYKMLFIIVILPGILIWKSWQYKYLS